jgi:cell division transport system permease protein
MFTLRKLWQNVRHDRTSLVLNVVVLTLTFFTVIVVGVGVANIDRLTRSIEDRYEVTVYLADDVTPERVSEVAAGLRHVQGVRDVTHLDPESFRGRFIESSGADLDGISEVSTDVFPSVLEVALVPDYREKMDLGAFAGKVSRIDAVESVETHEGWMQQLKGFAGVLGLVAAVFGISVLLCSVFIVANTIKLAFIKRQRVVEVMRLFGATRNLIEAPVLLEGALQGLVGSVIAVVLAWGLVAVVDARVAAILGGGDAWSVVFVPVSWVALFVAVCAAVGVIGAHLASARALRA